MIPARSGIILAKLEVGTGVGQFVSSSVHVIGKLHLHCANASFDCTLSEGFESCPTGDVSFFILFANALAGVLCDFFVFRYLLV